VPQASPATNPQASALPAPSRSRLNSGGTRARMCWLVARAAWKR
jgi:hypothetical protein